MLTRILEGNVVELRARFTEDGTTVTPDSVTFSMHRTGSPDAPVTAAGVEDEEGWWIADFKPAAAGIWRVRAAATNPDAVAEDAIDVLDSSF